MGSNLTCPFQPWNPEQSEDQSFENNANKSLLESLTSLYINYMTELIIQQVSSQTKRPVRVIRGAYSDKNKKERRIQSPYAPVEGFASMCIFLRLDC